MKKLDSIYIVAADRIQGDLLVHFSDGLSILYRAQFLYDVRNAPGNLVVLNSLIEEQSAE